MFSAKFAPKSGRCAFTLIELLVVVAIIALLVSILLPSLGRAKEITKQAGCMANMKALGMQLYLYGDEHAGRPPKLDMMEYPTDETKYRTGFWSGIMTQAGLMSSTATYCNNPTGYTGGSGKQMSQSKQCMDNIVDPIPATIDPSTGKSFYGTNSGDADRDGYDYIISLSWLGRTVANIKNPTVYQSWSSTNPRIGNEKVSALTVLLLEWNWRREVVAQGGSGWGQKGPLYPRCNFGPGSMMGVVGKDDWTGYRHTRHVGGTFGVNNFVFVDNHAEGIPAVFNRDYWWGTMIPGGVHPGTRYPQVGWKYVWNANNGEAVWSWNAIDY